MVESVCQINKQILIGNSLRWDLFVYESPRLDNREISTSLKIFNSFKVENSLHKKLGKYWTFPKIFKQSER